MRPAARRGGSPYLTLAAAVLLVSCGSVLVRLAEAPPLAVSFHRIFLAAAALAPFGAVPLARSWPALAGRQRAALVASGVALALHFATWIASLSYTTVAASVLLVNLAPVFTVALSRLFLRETPSAVVLGAIALALAGAAAIARGDWAAGAHSLGGDLLALVGAATLAIYHVVGRGLRQALPLTAYVFGVWATAALTLAVVALPLGVSLVAYPPRTFAFLALLALGPTLGGHGLVNRALRRLPAPTVGLFLLGEPIGASVLAYVVLGEVPGPWTLAGGAVVLVALAAVTLSRPS
jgi:drug/metabolite transporter (DMT)-like permease